jgi:hypothetical protein
VYGQNGANLTVDDTVAATDGGWATVFKRLLRLLWRTSAPYLSQWGVISHHYGGNDLANYGSGAAAEEAYKTTLRAIIGIARSARWYQDNNAAITKGGSHNPLVGTEDASAGGRSDYIAAISGSSNYWELAVPADYRGGGAVWWFFGGQSDNGGLATVTVDGGTPEAINGVAAATTIDTRGLANEAARNAAQGFRIPITASGAHTVRVTPTALTGAVMALMGCSIEAEDPPPVVVPKQNRLPSYTQYAGAPFPLTDGLIATFNSWLDDVAAEFSDERVIVVDADDALNAQSRYFHTDNTHLNDSGAAIFGGEVINGLRAAGLLDGHQILAGAEKGAVVSARQVVKAPCRVASPTGTNISVSSAPATIDGVTPDYFDRVLLKNQTAPAENGIYRWLGASRPMERADDFDSADEIKGGVQVDVLEGTNQNSRTTWKLANKTHSTPIVLGTTAIWWTRINPDVANQSPRTFWTPASNSLETIPRIQAATNTAVLSSGRLSLVGGIVIPAGQTVTSISFMSGTQAAVTPTNQLFGIFRQSDRALLRATSNGTNGAWAANTVKTLNLTATYTPDEDMPIYLGIMVTAGTVPSLTTASATSQANAIVPILQGTSTTGLTTSLPNPAAAITAAATNPYAFVS